jgi:hypothetical protein
MERGMQFITALFGGTENTLLNSAFALGIVLVLIVLGLWALKLLTRATGSMGRSTKRIVVIDKAQVDSKRQVVIIRRDNVEHVIMTGGPQDLIIESGVPVAPPAEPRRPAARPVRPAPQPAAATAADLHRPIVPERPVSRDAVDRLRDLARPAPLKPRPPGPSLRHTNLLRAQSARDGVIPMSPERRVDNSAGAPSDSATTAPVDGTNGQLRLGSRGRFFRGVIRGDRT